ncbi:sugar transferase [Chitinophaga sp. RAB17]|uniref:sugar transferase n=1 Tax=Chitinophaga sp. RAB17 TaxID=3233049 RepID=UPI003F8ECDAE
MYRVIKRIIDLIVAITILLILLPFLIPILLLLRFTGEGEIFYFQKRIGYKNEYFNIWKFATMLKNSPNMGTGSLTLRNDPRVTHVGRFLRITKLNELPQIINVLIGNMSIVGPRPQMKVDFDVYPEHVKERIYDVPPGITGIGSIIFRDEEKMLSETTLPPKEYYAQVIAPYKGELELWYQRNFSFLTDMKIVFLTAWVIFSPESDLPYKVFKDLPARSF